MSEAKGKLTERRTLTLERTYDADLEDVWDLWTTAEGLESWWGPDGFRIEVRSLDLRPGGQLLYAMIADGPQQVAFMKNAGMPLVQECLITYREIVPRTRLAYVHLTDFVPGVAPYDVGTVVELVEASDGVRMRVTLDAMHDVEWTRRAAMGWEMQLGKLAQVLAKPRTRPHA